MPNYLKFPGVLLSLALLVYGGIPALRAQPADDEKTAYTLASGDPWLDRTLPDINVYAQRYTESFLDELVRYAGMPRDYAYALIDTHGWFPADVYFAAMLAKTLNISYRDVVRMRARNPDERWETLISHLDGGPNAETRRRLREKTLLSYRHWARPLDAP